MTNTEVIRRFSEDLLEHPTDLGDLSFLDPDVVYEDEILPDHAGESYHGPDGFRRAWARAIEPWTDLGGRVEWVVGDGDAVVSCHYAHMRGRESGIEANLTYAYAWRFRDGKAVHCKSFPDPDAALRDAGIERA